MNPTRRRLGSPLILCAFAVLGLACNQAKTPTEPAVVGPTPTPTPSLATVRGTLVPAVSTFRHAFTVRIEVRETRGVGIDAMYGGAGAPGTSYSFPNRESGIQWIRIPAGGVGTTDVLIETDEDVPCTAGLTVLVWIRADDKLTASLPIVFGCATGYWPL